MSNWHDTITFCFAALCVAAVCGLLVVSCTQIVNKSNDYYTACVQAGATVNDSDCLFVKEPVR